MIKAMCGDRTRKSAMQLGFGLDSLKEIRVKTSLIVASAILFTVSPALPNTIEAGADNGCIKDGCHLKVKELLETRIIKHSPANKESCTVCHNPHGDEVPEDNSLKRPLDEVCFSCHTDLGKEIGAAQFLHTPVRKDSCGECHLPHGGSYTKLRKYYYPTQEWTVGNYGGPVYQSGNVFLCLRCHDENTFLHDKTSTKTGFRNGDMNLHQRHVGRKSYRPCEKCHAVHASDQEFHIRQEFPFPSESGLSLPIRFTSTPTGGGCVVGCHSNQAYDRDNPNKNSGLHPSQGDPDLEERERKSN